MKIKNNYIYLSMVLLLSFPGLSFAQVHWTGKVKWVTVKENDSAWIGLENPSGPNPNTAIWDCTNNIVWLGVSGMPASKNMLSTALTLYATQKNIRLGVRGNGDSCEATYVSGRE